MPPLTSCSAAHSRVSSGSPGSGARSGRDGRARQDRGAGLGTDLHAAFADEIDRAFELDAIDHDLDQVAVAQLADRTAGSASGETWPMQAPVETPLNRASVSSATCLPNGRYLSAEVSW